MATDKRREEWHHVEGCEGKGLDELGNEEGLEDVIAWGKERLKDEKTRADNELDDMRQIVDELKEEGDLVG